MNQRAEHGSNALPVDSQSTGSAGDPARSRTISRTSRIVIAAASLLLALTYYFPLWEIDLQAPQYPEGLGLEIWIDQIQGQNKGDLEKINNLNHYIGMKHIVPESIPELKIMPWIMRLVMVTGLIVAWIGRRKLLLVWLILFSVVAIAGLVDFYLWGYDYGHNLDTERAIIKVPGMSYQPPVFGSKKLLNFYAVSLPGIGGWAAILGFLSGIFVWLWEFLRFRRLLRAAATGLAAAVAISCSAAGPAEIHYGVDQCDYCKMTIADKSFGSQLITDKGRALRFDAIECLAAYERNFTAQGKQAASLWVSDFEQPGHFINRDQAVIIVAERQRSPMGVGLVAVASEAAARELIAKVGGRILDWNAVGALVAQEWNLEAAE